MSRSATSREYAVEDAGKRRPATSKYSSGAHVDWSRQPSEHASLSGAKRLESTVDTETFRASQTTGGDFANMLSPVTKSVVTGDGDDDQLAVPRNVPFNNSVAVVHPPRSPTTSGNNAAGSPHTVEAPSTGAALSSKDAETAAHIVLPEGVECCPIPRWNWTQSERSKQMGSSVSSSRASTSASPSCIGPSVFGVTDSNREAMENLSPFKQWEFTRFLAPQSDTTPTPSSAPLQRPKPTIVLDLDETLVHTSTETMPDADAVVTVHVPAKQSPGGRSSSYTMYIKYRHSLRAFLHYCLEHFDVVIFTASRNYYASAIVNQLEEHMPEIHFVGPEHHSASTQRNDTITLLSRDHCTPTNAGYVKDLFLLGCDLRRTVLVDNNIVCGAFQPFNFVHVKDFARRSQTEGHKSADTVKHEAEKGAVLPASDAKLASADATGVVSTSSANELLWVDPNDTVLEELICPGGLLGRLAKCDDIPSALRQILADSISRQSRSDRVKASS